jgi:hypothetical protein
MTADEIIRYVVEYAEAGASYEDIVEALKARGITKAHILRAREA